VNEVRIRVLIAVALLGLAGCRPVAHSPNADTQSEQSTPQTPPATVARQPELQAGALDFAIRLFQRLSAEQPKSNLCFSPLDIQQGLTLLLNGLQAPAYQEIATTLGYHQIPLEAINAFHRAVGEQLHTAGNAVEVRQSIALFSVLPYRWTAPIKEQAERWRPAALFELERTPEQPRTAPIQAWFQQQGNRSLPLSPEVWAQATRDYTLAGMVSALSLRAEWEQPLGKAPPLEFQTASGQKRQVAAMARLYKQLPYLDGDDLEAVALPYRGGQARFYLFLPREGVSLQQWIKQLSPERWQAWRKQFKERQVELWMPKFAIATEHDWQDTLKQMGIQSIFSDGGLQGVLEGAEKAGYLGLWTQAATIRVDEQGTEATADTSVLAFVQDYEIVQMKVDRPFAFAIVHEPTELILFWGVVHAP
jgi:serine protease inhibitor